MDKQPINKADVFGAIVGLLGNAAVAAVRAQRVTDAQNQGFFTLMLAQADYDQASERTTKSCSKLVKALGGSK